MTFFGVLSIVAVFYIIVFSGLSIEDFSNFFNEVFGITRDSAEVQNIQEEEVQKILTSNDVESNKEATNEVENKKVLSNKQRFFYFCVFLGLLLVILFGITFFTGTSVPENVDGTVTEAVVHSVPENIDGTVTEAIAHSADDSNSLSYSEDEYSDEFYA